MCLKYDIQNFSSYYQDKIFSEVQRFKARNNNKLNYYNLIINKNFKLLFIALAETITNTKIKTSHGLIELNKKYDFYSKLNPNQFSLIF